MKVLLISMNRDRAFRPALPLGMITVASELHFHGFACECLDLCFEPDPLAAVLATVNRVMPDIVGLSIRNTDQQTVLEPDFKLSLSRQVVSAIRRIAPACLIVIGGPAPSLFPEGILRFVGADFAIAGPGETSFVELLRRVEAGIDLWGIPGLCHLVNGSYVTTPQTSQFSRFGDVRLYERELYDSRYFSHIFRSPVEFDAVAEPVLTKRGCPGRCSYCGSSVAAGVSVIYRDITASVNQIEAIACDSRTRRFEFSDAAFNVPYWHAHAICTEMARRGLRVPWNCMLSPHPFDRSLAAIMAETGCDMVELGAESGCDRILSALRKHFRRDSIATTMAHLRGQGIRREVCVFVGSPGESLATIRESFEFLDGLLDPGSRDRVVVNFGFRLMPATELYRLAVDEGTVDPADDLAFPQYYVSTGTVADGVLEWIQEWALARPHWYIWWGMAKHSLRQRYEESACNLQKGLDLFRRVVPGRPPRTAEQQAGEV